MNDTFTVKRTKAGIASPGAIYAVALDGDSTVCMTEAHLDTWWNSLTPEEKGDMWARELEGHTDLGAAADRLEKACMEIMRSPLSILEVPLG